MKKAADIATIVSAVLAVVTFFSGKSWSFPAGWAPWPVLALCAAVFASAILNLVASHAKAKPDAAAPQNRPEIDPPRLLIRYDFKDGRELLTFSNDGGPAAHDVRIGPVTWTEQRKMVLVSGTPALPVSQSHTTWMLFERAPHHTCQLYSFLRKETPSDADARVTATYTDGRGQTFQRDFILTTYPDDTIAWNPGPVKLVSA